MLDDLKEFEKFLKLCRKQGVDEITFAGASIKFGAMAIQKGEAQSNEDIPTEELTPEQLMFYAVENAGAS